MKTRRQSQWQTMIEEAVSHLKGKDKKPKSVSDYRYILERCIRRPTEVQSNLCGFTVDLVVPVYNSGEALRRLLSSVEKTNIDFNVILMDDASDDEATLKFLEEYKEAHPKTTRLIHNEQNLGTVKTINRGLVMTRHHVVILDCDVELPERWLERLIAPIIKDPSVASAIPFSNNSRIAGFPDNDWDHERYSAMPVEEVDRIFQEVRCQYNEVPGGDGFCIALNKKVMQEIGILDQQNFENNYGTTWEWGLRASKAGYRNVVVENLYVRHGHMSGMTKEQMARLKASFEKAMKVKHPGFKSIMQQYYEHDPLSPIRAFVFSRLVTKYTTHRTLFFHDPNHQTARQYLERYRLKEMREKEAIITVTYNPMTQGYISEISWQNHSEKIHMHDLGGIFHYSDMVGVTGIVVNQLYGFPEIESHLSAIRRYSEKAGTRLIMMLHDYYPLCPFVHLLNYQNEYCQLPDMAACEKCLQEKIFDEGRPEGFGSGISGGDSSWGAASKGEAASGKSGDKSLVKPSMDSWRQAWGTFLAACHEIRVFSSDSEQMLKKVYPQAERTHVLDYEADRLPAVTRRYKRTDKTIIGVLGNLTGLKGEALVVSMAEKLERDKNTEIKIIGTTERRSEASKLPTTGHYQLEDLPALLLEEDVDAIFISSTCPEVFSPTTKESLEMGFPTASLAMGAAAERIRRSGHGLVLRGQKSTDCLVQLKEFAQAHQLPKVPYQRRVLFVYKTEDYIYRFRVEHLREQLLGYAIESDAVEVRKMSPARLKGYTHMVIFECPWDKRLRKVVDKAQKAGIRVIYSLSDVPDETLLGEAPEVCYRFFVPNEKLREAVVALDSTLPTVVQQNVASYEMLALCMEAAPAHENRINTQKPLRIGFIGAGKTSKKDFEAVAPIFRNILEEDRRIRLKVIGRVDLPSALHFEDQRTEQTDFPSWRKLPGLLKNVDVLVVSETPETDRRLGYCDSRALEAGLLGIPTLHVRDGKATMPLISEGLWEEIKISSGSDDAEEVLRTFSLYRELLADACDSVRTAAWEKTTATVEDGVLETFGILPEKEGQST